MMLPISCTFDIIIMVIIMQIRLTLKPRLKPHQSSFCIPCGYNYAVMSAIYRKLEEIGVSDFWHDTGFTGSSGKTFKGFVFGQLNGKLNIGPDPHIPGSDKKDHIFFHHTITLEIRSPLFRFIDDLQRAVELNRTIKLFDTKLDIIDVQIYNKHINSTTAVFQAKTPITIYRSSKEVGLPAESINKRALSVTPDEAEFFVRICNNYEEKFETIFRQEADPIRIKPIGCHTKKVVHFEGYPIEGYICKLMIQGTPQSLEFIFNNGLGESNSGGFGMVNLLTYEKTIRYKQHN